LARTKYSCSGININLRNWKLTWFLKYIMISCGLINPNITATWTWRSNRSINHRSHKYQTLWAYSNMKSNYSWKMECTNNKRWSLKRILFSSHFLFSWMKGTLFPLKWSTSFLVNRWGASKSSSLIMGSIWHVLVRWTIRNVSSRYFRWKMENVCLYSEDIEILSMTCSSVVTIDTCTLWVLISIWKYGVFLRMKMSTLMKMIVKRCVYGWMWTILLIFIRSECSKALITCSK